MASAALSEPQVLAHTKRRLFPDQDAAATYAVVDTQFATDEWRSGEPVDEDVRETLSPFNHVAMGSGYPDLVGVAPLDTDLLAVERLGDEPPLIAIEAKGVTDAGTVDTEWGILQAYDRLHEANVAYLAAPKQALTATDRTLARELNVGVLGVDQSGAVSVQESPRIVGKRSTDAATAIRFQASAQGVADKSFSLNHPKNYLGYTLAVFADGAPATLLDRYDIVGAVDGARRGAEFLGLVNERPDVVALTPLGNEVVRFALGRYDSVENALGEFGQWYRSTERFYDVAPVWGELTRRIIAAYPATELLVEELQTMHTDGIVEPSLVDLVVWLHEQHPAFTVELFVRGADAVRSRVITEDGALRERALEDGTVYHAPTVFQLKTMLFHAGVLTDRGTEPHDLEPTTDVWALRDIV
jgi:hypothetical protein